MMHIAICGPATLAMLAEELEYLPSTEGYPFPGTSALALSYIRSGYQVTLISTARDIDRTVKVAGKNLTLYVVPARPTARSKALDLFREERKQIESILYEISPDVVHAHWTYEFGLAARATPFPSLVTVHDWAPAIARLNKHAYWYFRAFMQFSCLWKRGAVSAPTQYIAKRVNKWYRSDCMVIPNGIDLTQYNVDLAQRDAVSVGMLNVGFSARKNVQVALIAWPEVLKAVPEATLHLGGPGFEVGGPAWTWAQQHHLFRNVSFEGALQPDAVPNWLASKTLFLHTSFEESFGVVLVEAMAAGTPVVAGYSSGAVPEVTKGAALLVDVSDSRAVSAAVTALLTDSETYQTMQNRGRETAVSYDIDRVTASYLGVLNSLLRK